MEDVHPFVEFLMYFGLGLLIAFVIIPVLMIISGTSHPKRNTYFRN